MNLDTTAIYHVCPNRAWFSSFKKLDGCFTIMGNYHPCNVEGMGTVRIKIFDEIVQELKEVSYVPQLKRNLIFLTFWKHQALWYLYEMVFSR